MGSAGELAVAEPLFEDLVAAEGVIPDVDGDGGPVGVAVEIDIDAGFAEEGEDVFQSEGLGGGEGGEFFALGFSPRAFGGEAAAGHDGAALAFVSPAGGELEGFSRLGSSGKSEGGEKGPLGGEVDAWIRRRGVRRGGGRGGRDGPVSSAVAGSGMRGQSPIRAPGVFSTVDSGSASWKARERKDPVLARFRAI